MGYQLGRAAAPAVPDGYWEARKQAAQMPEADFTTCAAEEATARQVVSEWGRRTYTHGMIPSTGGSMSMRCAGGGNFVISPAGQDRMYLTPDAMVRISEGTRERGKIPDAQVLLHQAIYRQHPEVESIIFSLPPNVLAFALAGQTIRPEIGSEVHMMLRKISHLPFGAWVASPEEVAGKVSLARPAAIFENEGLLVVGNSPFDTYDKVEVAEYTARSAKDAQGAGKIVELTGAEIAEINRRFASQLHL